MSSSDNAAPSYLKTVHKYLDAKKQLLWWEMDDIYILLGPFIVGILVNRVLFSLLFSLIAWQIYSKIKSANQEGYLLHLLYHLGLRKFKNCPDSWIKEMTE